ncbi:uncharacterized protein LOC143512923 [Brachyhypopomus gauderio]|uniref:uncharacterized protein LOC143512923 n=1 Tax=Brachyhypopomus gauderio TaxID=698409 RepID=UPI004041DBAC
MDMTNLQSLSVFLTERLTLAAQEIFKAVEVTVSEYHDEISRSRQENELLKTRLLEAGIEFYSDCPGAPALHEGAASVGRQPGAEPWGEDGADIQVKLELSATKDEPAAPETHGPAAKEPPSPGPWQEDEARVEEALHTLMAESDVSTLLHAAPLAQDVKEEPEDAAADLRTAACSGPQPGGATFDQACELEDGLEGHRLTSAQKAARSKVVMRHTHTVELPATWCSCRCALALCNHSVIVLRQAGRCSQFKIPAVPATQDWSGKTRHKPRNPKRVRPNPVNKSVVLSVKPKQKTISEMPRNTLYKDMKDISISDLPVLQLSDMYKDVSSDKAPLIGTMGIRNEGPWVESAFGKVPVGSVLSYQQPLLSGSCHVLFPDAPPPPALPLEGYRLTRSSPACVRNDAEREFLCLLDTTWEVSRQTEQDTRGRRGGPRWEELSRLRLTSSRARAVCRVRGDSSAQLLACRIERSGRPPTGRGRKLLATGSQVHQTAVEEYCRTAHVNYSPCGFVIHPDAPWMCASPDGLVYDPSESPPYGLVEVKCPNVKSFLDCSYVRLDKGCLRLHKQHAYYWQIQSQMLITGLEWCDFVVFANEDLLIQRVYKDDEVVDTIRDRSERFFFSFYMPRCLKA